MTQCVQYFFGYFRIGVRPDINNLIVALIICDEAQFYTPKQIEDLARIVDGLSIDVFAKHSFVLYSQAGSAYIISYFIF